jgi:biotin carboxyl carrier protein
MNEFKYLINGNVYTATLVKTEENSAEIAVNGTTYTVTPYKTSQNQAAYSRPAQAATPVDSAPAKAAPSGAVKTAKAIKSIKSPLPGSIISIDCKVGDAVKKGQKIIVLEAMKMENVLTADLDGTVSEILVNKGDTVLEGADLVILS